MAVKVANVMLLIAEFFINLSPDNQLKNKPSTELKLISNIRQSCLRLNFGVSYTQFPYLRFGFLRAWFPIKAK
jgi:hypothetical protein